MVPHAVELFEGTLLFALQGVEDHQASGEGRHHPLHAGELALGLVSVEGMLGRLLEVVRVHGGGNSIFLPRTRA